jgi:trigger factor
MSRGVVKALKDESIRPIAYPEIDESVVEIEDGKPLRFSFTLDVKPDVKIEKYTDLEAERPVVEVTDDEVEEEVQNLLRRMAVLEPAGDAEADYGDHLVLSMNYLLDDKKIHGEENVAMPLPEDKESEIFKVAPWVLETIGKKAGDEIKTEYKFPDSFPQKKARGKTGQVSARIDSVKRIKLPDLGEELLKTLEVESEEELRDKIRSQISDFKNSSADKEVEKEILNQLLESVPIDLPERVIEKSLESQAKKAELRLRQSKVPEEEIPGKVEEMRQNRRDEMIREFKAFFIIEEIAKREKVYVTEEEVQARIEVLAYNYGRWPQQVEQELEEKGLMDELRANLKEEKVLSFLREKAKITEKKPAEAKGGKKKPSPKNGD